MEGEMDPDGQFYYRGDNCGVFVQLEGCLDAGRIAVCFDGEDRAPEGTHWTDPDGKQVTPTEAMVVGEDSFKEQLSEGPVLFIGDGAGKCQGVINSHNAHFVQCCPKASGMNRPAVAALNEGKFEDVAYFEPYYLKEFMTTTSKKKLF